MYLTLLFALDTVILLLGYLVQPRYENFALSLCILFCPVRFLFLRGLLFSQGKLIGSRSGEERRWGLGAGRTAGKGIHSQEV